MLQSDLLFHNAADDKHYLFAESVVKDHKTLQIHINPSEEAITLEEVSDFAQKAKADEWLLSMGIILLLKKDGSHNIPLIERDILAGADPRKLTTPAGRLDMKLSDGFWAEFAEEMIWGSEAHYYALENAPESFYQIQRERTEALGLPEKPYQKLPITPLEVPHLWTVEMIVEGEVIDRCEDVYLYEDPVAKTLEFRKLWSVQRPEALEFFLDGDGYGREFLVYSVEELKQYLNQTAPPPTAEGYLNSLGGKKWKRLIQLPEVWLTKTVEDFLRI